LVARSKRLYIFRQACHATEVVYGSKTGPDLVGILNRQVAILEDSIHSGTLRGMGAAMPGLRASRLADGDQRQAGMGYAVGDEWP